MSTKPRATTSADQADALSFDPVPVRQRHDGWTPARQLGFIAALAATGCVTAACKTVGKSPHAAYDLFNRRDAASFRAAWRAALRHAANQLATAMVSRAIHGVAIPIFYKGEQVGERRSYDNRLGMWMLQHLAPAQFGAWRNGFVFSQKDADASAIGFHHHMKNLASDLVRDELGVPRKPRQPEQVMQFEDDAEVVAANDDAQAVMRRLQQKAEVEAWSKRMELINRGEVDPTDPDSFARWEQEQARTWAAQSYRQDDTDPTSAREGA